jgi:hypothetical protein
MADQFDDRFSSPDAVRLAKSLAVPRAGREARPASYRRATTPQMLAQNAVVLEDENRADERQRLLENNWLEWYKKNLSPEAIRRMTYDYAKNELGMSDRDAAIQADHAANTAIRTGYIADAAAIAPLAGGAVNFGREAIKTAEAMAAPRVAEAVAPRTLALPPPSPGPSSLIGRGQSGPVIEAGRPPVNIAEDFRKPVDYRYGSTGPKRQYAPEFERDMTYDPSDIYLGREGNRLRTGSDPRAYRPDAVSRETDPIARLGTESPGADVRLGEAGRNARAAEAEFQANRLAAAENEGLGGARTQVDKDFAQFQNELAAIEERGAGVQFAPPSPAGEVRSPLLDMPLPGVKRRLTPAAEPAPAQPTFDFGGPQSVGGQMVDPLTGRAYMPRQFPQTAPQPATGSLTAVQRAEALIPQRPVDLNALLSEPRVSPLQGVPAAEAAPAGGRTIKVYDPVTGQTYNVPDSSKLPFRLKQQPGAAAAEPNALIDQAIADATGTPPASQMSINEIGDMFAARPPVATTPPARTTFGLRQRAPVAAAEEAPAVARPAAAGEAPAAAAPAEKAFSAADVAELRANGFNELADQVEAVLAKNAQAAAAPAAAAATPAAAAPAAAALPPLGGRLAKGLLGAGTVGAGGLAVATADRDNRRLQKAAIDRQRIDDMEDAALAASRGRSQNAQDYSQFSEYGDPTKMFEGNYANFQRYGSPTPPAQSQRPEYTSGNAPAQQRPAPAPAGGGSFLDKIFSGKDYQSSGGQLQQQQGGNRVLNWGDSDNAADFFRADAMRKRMEDQKQQFTGESGSDIDYRNRMAASQAESEGKARGGAAQQKPSKEAMLHKSLEIIHHMIKNR